MHFQILIRFTCYSLNCVIVFKWFEFFFFCFEFLKSLFWSKFSVCDFIELKNIDFLTVLCGDIYG